MSTLRLFLSFAVMAVAGVGQGISEGNFKQKFEEAERHIVRLPPTAFPAVPGNVVRELQRRGCTIPQEAFTTTPHNVIRGEFLKPGQTDWAVLCSVNGSSSVLVFWNGSTSNPSELAEAADKNYLQGLGGDRIGFSRGINAIGRDFIMKHYRAYGGPKPPPINHQGINDAFLEKASVVNYFLEGKWLQLTGAD